MHLFVLLAIIVFTSTLSACSGKNTKTAENQKRITVEDRLHRAVFSQDIERIEYAIKLGADVNAPIYKSEHKMPAVEMPVKHSSPLNAIISDYKYQDQLYVAPLEPGQSFNSRAIAIIKLLLDSGADVQAPQFYPNKNKLSFELGGPRLALAMPLLIDAGFKPTVNELLHAYQHYSSFKKASESNKSIIRYLKDLENPLPKKIRQFLERYDQEVQKQIEAQRDATAQEKFKAQKYKEMKDYASIFISTEPFSQGQKACLFEDYIFTLGFVVLSHSGKNKLGFKPAYSYRYNGNGFKRGSRERDKSAAREIDSSRLSKCPSGA